MRVHGARGGCARDDRPRRQIIGAIGKLALVVAAIVAVEGVSLSINAQATRGLPPAFLQDLTWQCVGPFEGGPVASVAGLAGEPGVYEITTPSGGSWKTIDGGATWTSIGRSDIAPGSDPHRWIDPGNPRRIARTDAQGIGVSLDAGTTWMAFHVLPIAEVRRLPSHEHATEPAPARRTIAGRPAHVSIADPVRPGLMFAGTDDAVYVSVDGGTTWTSLQLNMPAAAINDLDIRGHDLVAATQGRSVWVLADISPLRQFSAASASAPAILFKPSDAAIPADAARAASLQSVALDYYLAAAAPTVVKLDVLDASGRVIHSASSAVPDATDRWLPVTRPLPVSAGHHRVTWNLRFEPPPSPHHRFARLAPALFEAMPPDPDGPRVLAGSYRVRLTVGGHIYSQPLTVRSELSPEASDAARQQFQLALRAYDAMQIAHRGFVQLKRAREQLKPFLTATDPDVAAAAQDLDARLAVLDGSEWTGLVIPDADDEVGEVDEKEGKHPDFVPPKAVSLSKDYDDPTSVLGRNFANVDHAPAFAILGTKLGEVLTRVGRDASAPDASAVGNYATACQQLAGVLDAWRAINTHDLPRVNAVLATRTLPSVLPIASNVPAIACPAGAR